MGTTALRLAKAFVTFICFNRTFQFITNLQPDLSGALFYWWLSLSKPAIKKAGAEGGNVSPKNYSHFLF